jgi:hypothetical protein
MTADELRSALSGARGELQIRRSEQQTLEQNRHATVARLERAAMAVQLWVEEVRRLERALAAVKAEQGEGVQP